MSTAVPPSPVTAGLDIGGTKIHAVLLGHDDDVLASVRTATVRGPENVTAGALEVVTRLAHEAQIPLGALTGVGVGIPGVVDRQRGTVAHAVNLGIVDGPLALAARLEAALGLPVTMDNDVDAAAVGAAHHRGDGADVALLSLGTGLAAGLVLDGVVRRGCGAAGEVGHLPVVPGGPLCPCGQRGCLELYASGTALDRAWPARDGLPAPAALFAAAATGDDAAIRVRDEYADAVALGVRVLALSVDPAHVLLGGGVSRLGEPLLDAVRAALQRQAAGSPFLSSLRLADRLALVPAHVPIGATGAALLARG